MDFAAKERELRRAELGKPGQRDGILRQRVVAQQDALVRRSVSELLIHHLGVTLDVVVATKKNGHCPPGWLIRSGC